MTPPDTLPPTPLPDKAPPELLQESRRATPNLEPPLLPLPRARQKHAAGTPLLHGELLDPDQPACRELFARLLDLLPHHPQHAPEAAAIAHALQTGRLDLGRALEEALAAHPDHLAALAAWSDLPSHPLLDLLELAVRPSLRAVATAYRPLLNRLDPWPPPYCPVCGAAADITAAQATCPRCDTTWSPSPDLSPASPRSFRLELGEPEPDEALEALLELD